MRYSKWLLARKLSFVFAPLLALPLLFFGKEYRCLYCLAVMCSFWVSECIPMGITALLPLLLFPFFEIMKAESVSETYFKDTTVLGFASLLMGNAVEEVMLHKRIALGMLRFVGYRKQLLLAGTILVTGLVSMLVADMAACVIILPIILAILKTLHDVKEQFLIAKKTGSLVGDRLNMSEWSKGDRGFAKALVMACATASLFGGKGTLTGSTPNIVFREQFGPVEAVSYLQWASFSIPFMFLGLALNYIILTVVFLLPSSCGSREEVNLSKEEKTRVKVLLTKKIQEEYDHLGKFSFAEGSVLVWFLLLILAWMSRNPGFTKGWEAAFPRNYVTDGTTAMMIVIIMFIWPKDPFNDIQLEPILTWEIMKARFSWSCVLLVAVGNAVSAGVEQSGLSFKIGCFLKDPLRDLSPFWLQVLAQLSASIVSEFTSNTSTAGIFIPIMIGLANAFHLNPLYLVLPATYASSWGFMMPTATPANAIVYDTGVLTLFEMCTAGFFLKIGAIALTALNFETLAYKLLKLDEPLLSETYNRTVC